MKILIIFISIIGLKAYIENETDFNLAMLQISTNLYMLITSSASELWTENGKKCKFPIMEMLFIDSNARILHALCTPCANYSIINCIFAQNLGQLK